MSKSIDERIVQMEFKNDKFKDGVKETIDSLQKLKKESDLKELQSGAKNFDLSGIKNQAESLKFTFKDVFKFTFFQNIANDIQSVFKNAFMSIPNMFNKAMSIIETKGWNRAANLENAKFQLTGLEIEWESVAKQIDNAVSGTAYGLDSAAKAAAQLAASGVRIGEGFKAAKGGIEGDVDEMERALGAISGIAAMTNSTYDEVADIFTDAAGRGKVSADTFNRIAQRGLNASAELAKSMGITEEEVRNLASKGKISFQEFSDAMYNAYYEQAKKSNETFDGALSNMQFALGKIGAEFATPIRLGLIEPFNEVRKTINNVKAAMTNSGLFEYFTNLTTVASKMFVNFMQGFRLNNKNFQWVYNLTDAFKNLCELLLRVLVPIKDAFKSAFGSSIIELFNLLTKKLADFLEKIKPTAEGMHYIRMAFEAFFIILKNTVSLFGKYIHSIASINIQGKSLFSVLGIGLAIILKILEAISSLSLKLYDVIGGTTLLNKAINILIKGLQYAGIIIAGSFSAAISTAYNLIKSFIELFSSKINSPSTNPLVILFQEIVRRTKQIPEIFPKIIQHIKDFINAFKSASSVTDKIKVLSNVILGLKIKISDVFQNIAKNISELGSNTLLTQIISSIVSGIGVIIKDIGNFASIVGSVIVSGLLKAANAIKQFFETFSENMKKFNGNILLAFWKTFSDGINNFIKNIPTAINGIQIFFKELNILDSIKDKFSNFMDFMSKFVIYLKNCFSTFGVCTVYAAELDTAVGEISGTTNKSNWDTSGITNFISKFKEFISTIDYGKIAVIAYIAVIISVILQIKKFIKSLTTAIDSITGVFKGYFDTLSEASKQKTTLNEVATSLLKLAGAIAILVGSLVLLSLFTENHDITKAGATIAILAIGILTFVGALAIMQKEMDLGFLIKFSAVLIVIAAAMLILVKALNNIDIQGVETRFITLSLLMGELALVAGILSKYAPELLKGSLSLVTFATSLLILSKALNKVPELINIAGDIIILSGILGVAAYLFGQAATSFGDALKSFGMAMASIAATVLMITITIKILDNMGDISTGLISLVEILSVLLGMSVIIVFINKKIGDSELPKFNASMILLAGSVAILAATAKMMGNLSLEQIVKGLIAIQYLLGLVSLLMFMSQYTENAHPVKFAASLLIITSCIGMLAGLSALIGLIKIEQLAKGIGAIALLNTMIGGLMWASKFTENANTGAIVAALIGCGIILSMLLALTLTDKDSWGQVYLSLGVIAGVLLSFGGMMALIGKGNYTKNGGKALLAMIAIVGEIGIALFALAYLCDWQSLIAAAYAMTITLLAFGGTLAIISNIKGLRTERVQMFLIASLALIPIGIALLAVAQCDWNLILVATGAIIATLYAIVGVIAILSSNEVKTAGVINFLLASLSLFGIAEAISRLASFDWPSLLSAAGGLAAVVLAIGGAIALMSGNALGDLAGAASLIIVGLALMAIIDPIQKMASIEWGTLGKAGAVIAVLALALAGLGLVGPVVILGAAALFVGAVALDLVAVAMIGAAKAFEMFLPSFKEFVSLPLASIAPGLMLISLALNLFGMAGIAMTLGMAGLIAAAFYMGPLADGLAKMAAITNLLGIPGPLALIGAAGLVLGLAAPGMALAAIAIKLLAPAVESLGKSVFVASSLIEEGVSKICAAFKELATTVVACANYIGANIVNGITKGIGEGLPNIVKSAASMATGIITTVKSVLDINSPSKVMTWIGEMCGIGIDEGMNDADVWNAIKTKLGNNLNNGIIAPAANAIDKIKSLFGGLSGTMKNFSDGWENKVPSSVKKTVEAMNGVYKEGFSLNSLLGNFTENLLNTDDITNQLTESMDGLTDSLGGAGGGGGGGAAGAAKEADDAFSKLSDTIAGQIDIFSEFSKSTDMTSDKLLENMRSQIKGVTEWSNMMTVLAAKGIDQGLLAKLADMGPQGYEYVNAFVNMTGEQLQEANLLYQQSLILPKSAAKTITNSFAQAGNWCTQGLIQGTDKEAVNQNGIEMADAMLTGFENEAGIASPSVVMSQNGRWLMIGLKNGMDQTATLQTIPKATSIAKKILDEFANNLTYEKFYECGENVMIGLMEGLKKHFEAYERIVNFIATELERIYREENDEHSPSRLMRELGAYAVEGLILGLKDQIAPLEKVSEEISTTTSNILKEAINDASKLLDDDMTLNPVITPVIDLDNIQNGANSISSMLNNAINASSVNVNGARLSGNYNTNGYIGDANNQTDKASVGGVTYVQNNYSPKALSRIDIYRQTEAQLQIARG